MCVNYIFNIFFQIGELRNEKQSLQDYIGQQQQQLSDLNQQLQANAQQHQVRNKYTIVKENT